MNIRGSEFPFMFQTTVLVAFAHSSTTDFGVQMSQLLVNKIYRPLQKCQFIFSVEENVLVASVGMTFVGDIRYFQEAAAPPEIRNKASLKNIHGTADRFGEKCKVFVFYEKIAQNEQLDMVETIYSQVNTSYSQMHIRRQHDVVIIVAESSTSSIDLYKHKNPYPYLLPTKLILVQHDSSEKSAQFTYLKKPCRHAQRYCWLPFQDETLITTIMEGRTADFQGSEVILDFIGVLPAMSSRYLNDLGRRFMRYEFPLDTQFLVVFHSAPTVIALANHFNFSVYTKPEYTVVEAFKGGVIITGRPVTEPLPGVENQIEFGGFKGIQLIFDSDPQTVISSLIPDLRAAFCGSMTPVLWLLSTVAVLTVATLMGRCNGDRSPEGLIPTAFATISPLCLHTDDFMQTSRLKG